MSDLEIRPASSNPESNSSQASSSSQRPETRRAESTNQHPGSGNISDPHDPPSYAEAARVAPPYTTLTVLHPPPYSFIMLQGLDRTNTNEETVHCGQNLSTNTHSTYV